MSPASLDALIAREVEAVRRAVVETRFPHDPMLGALSQIASLASSLVRRHGLACAAVLAKAIDILAGDRFEVLPELAIPLSGAGPRSTRRQKTATSERHARKPTRAPHDTSLDEAFAAVFEDLLDRDGTVPTLGDSLADEKTRGAAEAAASRARDGVQDARETTADPKASRAANCAFGADPDTHAVAAIGPSTEFETSSEMADVFDGKETVWSGNGDPVPSNRVKGASSGDLARLQQEARQRAIVKRADLSPAAAAVLFDLERQLDEEARASLAGPGRCLLHLREIAESPEWLTVGSAAWDALLQAQALPGPDDPGSAFTDLIVFGGSAGKKGGTRPLTDVTHAFTR